VAEGRGGTWGPGPAPTNIGTGAGGYEQADQPQASKEPHGPTYNMVVSQKAPTLAADPQDPHFLGQLMPVSHSRSDEVKGFFNAQSVTG
jgi:hypothetical protein